MDLPVQQNVTESRDEGIVYSSPYLEPQSSNAEIKAAENRRRGIIDSSRCETRMEDHLCPT